MTEFVGFVLLVVVGFFVWKALPKDDSPTGGSGGKPSDHGNKKRD